jgi:hypothetical protein
MGHRRLSIWIAVAKLAQAFSQGVGILAPVADFGMTPAALRIFGRFQIPHRLFAAGGFGAFLRWHSLFLFLFLEFRRGIGPRPT